MLHMAHRSGSFGRCEPWGSAPDPEVYRLTAEMFPPPAGAWIVAPGASPGDPYPFSRRAPDGA